MGCNSNSRIRIYSCWTKIGKWGWNNITWSDKSLSAGVRRYNLVSTAWIHRASLPCVNGSACSWFDVAGDITSNTSNLKLVPFAAENSTAIIRCSHHGIKQCVSVKTERGFLLQICLLFAEKDNVWYFHLFISASRWSFLFSGSVPTSHCVLSLWLGLWMHPVLSLSEWTPDILTSTIPHQMWFVWTLTPTLSTCELNINFQSFMKLHSRYQHDNSVSVFVLSV